MNKSFLPKQISDDHNIKKNKLQKYVVNNSAQHHKFYKPLSVERIDLTGWRDCIKWLPKRLLSSYSENKRDS